MSEVNKEIEEMISDLTAQEPSKEEPTEEPTPAEPPVEETKPEPEPEPIQEVHKPEAKGEVIEEQPVVETPPVESAQPAEDPRITQMQKTINEMAQQLLESKGAPQPKPEVQVAPPQEPQVEIDLNKFEILPQGMDFEDVVNDKGTFEKWARDLLSRYEVSRVRRDALTAPTMVSRQVQMYMGLNEAVRTFYDSNKDLVSVKPLVGAYANRLVAEHPDWTLPKVMEESAKATRQALGMVASATPAAPAAPVQSGKVVNPSFAKPNQARKPAAQGNVTKLQKDISDLIDGI